MLALHEGPSGLPRGHLPFLGTAFFVSGASALVYQVAWQRILALHTGVGIESIAVIVGAFMAGLGIGSHLGGRLSLRLTAKSTLVAFASLEIAIAAWGALSGWLYYDVLYVRLGSWYADAVRGALLHMVTLLPPTILMGMSLPFLVRGSVRSASTAGRTIGVLYGVNVLGASAGALLAPWVLVRFFGLRGALVAAAIGNALSGLCALWVATRTPPVSGEKDGTASSEGAPAASIAPKGESRPLGQWVGLYAASGFCALSLELLWFRLVEVAVKSTAFTFGTVLAFYLLGAGLGSVVTAGLVRRITRPLSAFLLCQCLLLAYAGAIVALLVAIPLESPLLRAFVAFWREPSGGFVLPGTGNLSRLANLYLLLPTALFGPPTILMGASFPILHRAVQDDPRTSGQKAGLLQAANLAGCILGSLGIGLLGLRWFGTAGTLRLLMVMGLGLALLGLRTGRPRVFAPLGAVLLVLTVVMPDRTALWCRLHGVSNGSAYVDEDPTGVAALIPSGVHRWNVVFGGKRHSWIPFGGVHSHLGAVAALVHPAPTDIAIVGLGSGDTAWAASCREETRSVTIFELSAMQPKLLRRLLGDAEVPKLRQLLDDPRVRIALKDGRNALASGAELYDVIEADALWPSAAYSGNLYSEQFFALCARKLKPGGLLCTWAPTGRVSAGFARVFPHVVAVAGGSILLGSKERIPLARDLWRESLLEGPVKDYLGASLAHQVLERLRAARRVELATDREANDDLFPRDEFASPARKRPATVASQP